MSIAAAVGQRVHRPAADASFAIKGQATAAVDHLPLAVITSISINHRQGRRLICTTTASIAEDKDAQRGGPRRRVLVVGEVIQRPGVHVARLVHDGDLGGANLQRSEMK